jgi:putative ABC transport system substrate-binding protein
VKHRVDLDLDNNMKRTIVVLLVCVVLFAVSVSGQAQQTKIPRIGYVSGAGDSKNPGANVEAFRRGLQDLGYNDGKNILLEHRYIEGQQDRVPNLVADLVRLNVDVLVVTTLAAIRAAKQATKTIPIVMVSTVDPVATGLIDSLAHPGGNVTGVTRLTREVSGKRLELLKEVVPSLSRVGIIRDAEGSGSVVALKEYDEASHALKLQIQPLEVKGPNPDMERAFQAATKARAGAIVTITGTVLNPYAKLIADLASKNRLPSMHEHIRYVEAGGLMSYSGNDTETFKHAAHLVDKILKGAKPSELPVEQPTKFELVINLKAAKRIGVTISQSVLYRADRVIK